VVVCITACVAWVAIPSGTGLTFPGLQVATQAQAPGGLTGAARFGSDAASRCSTSCAERPHSSYACDPVSGAAGYAQGGPAWIGTFPFPYGSGAGAMAVVPSMGELFVAEASADAIAVISTTNGRLLGSIPTTRTVSSMALDTGTGEIFASTESGNITVISLATDQVVANLSLGEGIYGYSLAYDSGRGEVFVLATNDSSSASRLSFALVISDETDRVVANVTVGYGAQQLAYDSAQGYVFVDNSQSANISVISDTTDRLVSTISLPASTEYFNLVYDPIAGLVFVSDNFYEQPILRISASTLSIVSNISVADSADDMVADSNTGEVFAATNDYPYEDESECVLVASGGSAATATAISIGAGPGSSLSFDNQTGDVFVADSDGIAIIADGSRPTYTVTFDQSVLAPGTLWNVSFFGDVESSTGGSVVFPAENGTYVYSASTTGAVSQAGIVRVDGESIVQNVTFGIVPPTLYAVTFTEQGLPTGVEWTVTLGNDVLTSFTSVASFEEPNGSPQFSIASVAGYVVAPPHGQITIDGGPVGESVTFSPASPASSAGGAPPGSILGLSAETAYILLAIVVAITMLALAIMLRRRGSGG
jgi:DNA-binding beta-propeller fold protein YncE